MRLIANIKHPDSDVKRLMIYDTEDGVYLFGYDKESDSNAIWDSWFEKLEYAFEASQEYGVDKDDWKEISNPLEDCQHDWIEPVRVKGRDAGNPEWNKLEKLVNGEWIEINLDMNKLDFEIIKDVINDYSTFSTQILIDGKNLIDLLKDYELPLAKKEGTESIAGAYDGLDPKVLFANLTNSTDNQNSENNKSDILDCECGSSGCWTFMVKVIEKQDTVIWTEFEQIHRSKDSANYWDYSDFKDFKFNKNEYLKKLNELITTHNNV